MTLCVFAPVTTARKGGGGRERENKKLERERKRWEGAQTIFV